MHRELVIFRISQVEGEDGNNVPRADADEKWISGERSKIKLESQFLDQNVKLRLIIVKFYVRSRSNKNEQFYCGCAFLSH